MSGPWAEDPLIIVTQNAAGDVSVAYGRDDEGEDLDAPEQGDEDERRGVRDSAGLRGRDVAPDRPGRGHSLSRYTQGFMAGGVLFLALAMMLTIGSEIFL